MPSKQAIKFMRCVRRKGEVARSDCIEAKEKFLLDDLVSGGYLESLGSKYLDRDNNVASLSSGKEAKYRLSDKGYEYLELHTDRVIDRWFTRSISVLALLISLATLLITSWKG